MKDFVIYTDSACDIAKEILDSWEVKRVELTFKFSDSDEEFFDSEFPAEKFYAEMRAGRSGKTAAVNVETFKDAFRRELEEGLDVLYLGFSSGLSNTYNAGRIAAEELIEEFPERRVIAVDTLSASAGQGLLIYYIKELAKGGAAIEECARFCMEKRLNLCHWFTVDDLKYLKRGGRISASAAFVGGVLNIKPVLHMDDKGHLVNVMKVRGRKAALSEMASKYDELALDKNGKAFICHGDCIDDANAVKALLEEKGASVELITFVGPVIGTHSGPGTLAIFFLGKER